MYTIRNIALASAVVAVALLASPTPVASANEGVDAPRLITAVLVKQVPIYTDDLKPASDKPVKKRDFAKNFSDQPDGDPKGLPILERRTIENVELIKVSLANHGEVWVESASVQVHPSTKVDCPTAALPESEKTKRATGTGFGSCTKPDAP